MDPELGWSCRCRHRRGRCWWAGRGGEIGSDHLMSPPRREAGCGGSFVARAGSGSGPIALQVAGGTVTAPLLHTSCWALGRREGPTQTHDAEHEFFVYVYETAGILACCSNLQHSAQPAASPPSHPSSICFLSSTRRSWGEAEHGQAHRLRAALYRHGCVVFKCVLPFYYSYTAMVWWVSFTCSFFV